MLVSSVILINYFSRFAQIKKAFAQSINNLQNNYLISVTYTSILSTKGSISETNS
jgi:hypothetical protein